MDIDGARNTWIGLLPMEEALRLTGIEFLSGMVAGIYPRPPFTQTSGVMLRSVEVGHAVFEAIPSASFYNPLGVAHGGWTALLLDTAMGCAVHTTLTAGQTMGTIDMTSTFVRPIRQQTGALRCEGWVLHRGGRIASAEGKIFDGEGRLVAHGTESCMITDVDPARLKSA